MIKITNNDLSVLDSNKIQVLDVNATWCGPCRFMKPQLEKLEEKYPEIQFADIDADDNEELMDTLNIKNVPTIIIRKGDIEKRIAGANVAEVEKQLTSI